MLPISKDVLDIVMLNLQRYVAPQVTSDEGRLALFMINYILGTVFVEEHDLPELQEARFANLEPVFGAILRELNEKNVDGANSLVGDARTAIRHAMRAPADSEATDRALQLGLKSTFDTGKSSQIPEWRRSLFETETHYVEQLTDRMEQWAYGGMAKSQPEVGQRQLNPDLVSQYLKGRFPQYPSIEAREVTEIPGGFSKKTYKLSVANGPKDWDSLVIRQDVIGGPTPASCIGEVDVVRLAERHGIPVAHVVHVEPSLELDAPFLIARRMPGICDLSAWKKENAKGELPSEQLAVHVARLHRIPPDELPGWDKSLSAQDLVHDGITAFERRWERDRPMADPLLEFAVQWLKTHVPTNITQLSIVHADISIRNVLIDEGQVSAILDWELWHVGDPMYDLAYIRAFIGDCGDWEKFVGIYEAHGGFPVSMVNDDFWFIFSEVRNSLMLASGLRTFVDGRNRNIKTIGPVMGQYRNRLRLAMRRLRPRL